MSGPYDDIINLPHHVSTTRPQMSMADRASQFSPFAALTGYDAAIKETGRLTDSRIELGEETLRHLNERFQFLVDGISDTPIVHITFFVPDERKAGGAYITVTGTAKKVDTHLRMIILQDGTKIPMDDIISIEGDVFSAL